MKRLELVLTELFDDIKVNKLEVGIDDYVFTIRCKTKSGKQLETILKLTAQWASDYYEEWNIKTVVNNLVSQI